MFDDHTSLSEMRFNLLVFNLQLPPNGVLHAAPHVFVEGNEESWKHDLLQILRGTCWTFVIKQPTNKLKIRILSETSLPYLICHASFILIVGLHL